VCTEDGDATLTSNADKTGCEINQALLSASIVEAMFTGGLALYGTFIIATVFAVVGGAVTLMREKEPGRLANYSRLNAAYFSCIPGLSFGADFFLILGVWAESPGLGATMLLARLLHLVGGVVLLGCVFSSEESVREASVYLDYFLEDACSLRDYIDESFSYDNVPVVDVVSLLSLCDVSMLQFLPWKKSRFYVVSEGYPSLSFMRTTLMIKTAECFVTVTCEAVYLLTFSNVASNPLSSPMAQGLFYTNMIMGVLTVIMDLVTLLLRGRILRHESSVAVKESVVRRTSLTPSAYAMKSAVDAARGAEDGLNAKDQDSESEPAIELASLFVDGDSASIMPSFTTTTLGGGGHTSSGSSSSSGLGRAGVGVRLGLGMNRMRTKSIFDGSDLHVTANPMLAAGGGAEPSNGGIVGSTTTTTTTTTATATNDNGTTYTPSLEQVAPAAPMLSDDWVSDYVPARKDTELDFADVYIRDSVVVAGEGSGGGGGGGGSPDAEL
jgi:hypothetical protein